MDAYTVTLRFDGDDPWQETYTIMARSLADADNLAVRMQDERDADAVSVLRMEEK